MTTEQLHDAGVEELRLAMRAVLFRRTCQQGCLFPELESAGKPDSPPTQDKKETTRDPRT